MVYTFKHLAVGGTFDLFHRGHKELINFAFQNGERVSIGISSDKFVIEGGKKFVKTLELRQEELERYLLEENLTSRAKIVLLNDVYGSTLTDKSIEGLVITEETEKGANLINQKRKSLGLNPLPLIQFPMVEADDGLPISTTRIRKGLIDREGFSYLAFLSSARRFILPDKLREELSRVHGKLMLGIGQVKRLTDDKLITVGDVITSNFIKLSILPDLAIVDFRINRKEVFHKISDLGFPEDQEFMSAKNEHGTIDRSLIEAISEFFKSPEHPEIIKVDGEEDLAVLPVVLLAPLGTQVYYGQPNQGLVLIEITEDKKSEFLKILKKFQVEVKI